MSSELFNNFNNLCEEDKEAILKILKKADLKPPKESEQGNLFYIDHTGYIKPITDIKSKLERCEVVEEYNFYNNIDTALTESDVFSVIRKLRHTARCLNENTPNDEECYIITKNKHTSALEVVFVNHNDLHICRFDTRHNAQTAINHLTESERMVLCNNL